MQRYNAARLVSKIRSLCSAYQQLGRAQYDLSQFASCMRTFYRRCHFVPGRLSVSTGSQRKLYVRESACVSFTLTSRAEQMSYFTCSCSRSTPQPRRPLPKWTPATSDSSGLKDVTCNAMGQEIRRFFRILLLGIKVKTLIVQIFTISKPSWKKIVLINYKDFQKYFTRSWWRL